MKSIDIKKFEILKDLGYGSFGHVYILIDLETSKKYAGKELKMNNLNQSMINFYQEVQCYLRLNNPSILKFYGYSLHNKFEKQQLVIILEYMENSSLDKALKKKILSPTDRYIDLIGIAIGIKYLHSQGVVHRDIKPNNILLNNKFYPKICDFGLSLISNANLDHFYMSEIVGTPLYTAPEIYDSKYTYKVDIFSFSFIFYELLTNHELFNRSIIRTKCKIKKSIERGLRPDLSIIPDKNIQKFMGKCWSNDPSKRPSSGEIVNELLNNRYKKLLNVNEKKLNEYLNLFDKDLLNPNKYKEFQYKNKQIYHLSAFMLEFLLFFLSVLFAFQSIQFYRNTNICAIFNDKFCHVCRYHIKINASDLDIKKMADKGNPFAMNYYGSYLLKYFKTLSSKKKAIYYFKKSADLGDKYGMYNYGLLLLEGKIISTNKVEASKYLKLSADLGNREAMYLYAQMKVFGNGVPKKYK